MNKLLSDFVNNPILFFTAFILILIGVVVLIFSMYHTKKNSTENNIKTVDSQYPILKKLSDDKKEFDSLDIEAMLKEMQKEVDQKHSEIDTFEDEQEEKSIISYQELLNNAKLSVKEPESEVEKFVSQIKGGEPIIEAHEKEFDNIQELESKKFKGSEFISPIYGRVTAPEYVEKPNTPIIRGVKKTSEIETLDIDFDDELPRHAIDNSFDIDLSQSDEFLNALKEFRKNLE